MLAEPSDEAKLALERWLTRYGAPDAFQKWRTAQGTSKAPFFAFSCIAGAHDMLTRLPVRDAAALARSAETMIAEVVLSNVTAPATRTTSLAAEIVQARIAAWRKGAAEAEARRGWGEMRPAVRRQEPDGIDDEPRVVTEQWMLETLRREFPHVRSSCARYAFKTTHRLGVAGLLAIGSPIDRVLAMAAARVAAQSSLDQLPGEPLPEARCLEVIHIVQDWALQTGQNPLADTHFAGPRTSVLARVRERAVDANACVAMAARLPGGVQSPGYAQWEDALENHSFVLMSSRNYAMNDLTYDEARDIGSAAARLAAFAIAQPACALPRLPEGWSATPNMVFKMVTSVIGQDLVPRLAPITAFRRQPAPPDFYLTSDGTAGTEASARPVFHARPAWTGVAQRR